MMERHVVLRDIGSPPQPVEAWLVQCAEDCEDAADRTWLPWRRRRWESMAYAYRTAQDFLRNSMGQP